MRIQRFFFVAIAAISLFTFNSCKKSSDPAPTPVPTVKPDTLSAGWSKQVIAGETNTNDIFFNSPTNGYLCGTNLYKSTDGGINWVKLTAPTVNWHNCFVTPDNKAFFLTYSSSSIFKTLDGGSSFTNPAIGSPPTDIFFTDNNNGFCIANDGLYNTVDAGVTWQKISTTGLPLIGTSYASLSFLNNTTGLVISPNGIYRCNGSVTNWQQSVLNGSTSGTSSGSLYIASASIVYAAGGGEVFKSTDGGANFNFIKKFEDPGFTDIHFLTDQLGYVSCGRSIYKTSDGGINWSKVVSLGEGSIIEIHFTDATHGWACGSNGTVLIFK